MLCYMSGAMAVSDDLFAGTMRKKSFNLKESTHDPVSTVREPDHGRPKFQKFIQMFGDRSGEADRSWFPPVHCTTNDAQQS